MLPSREETLHRLKALLPELQSRYGMQDVAVFGSMARGDYDEQSDVDILSDFTKPIGWEIVSLEAWLETRLQRKVQVFHRKALSHSPLAAQILQDLVAV